MNPVARSVFLSYASQDAEAARRICDALRAAGVEVWFDQSELRGGDAWDASIRNQIKTCALFVPLISHSTHAREEGYFRLEWKLAVDRSHLMSATRTFLLPVVVDETPENDPGIPDRFREVQWTKVRSAEALAAFVERVRRLLVEDTAATTAASAPPSARVPSDAPSPAPVPGPALATKPRKAGSTWLMAGVGAVAVIAIGLYAVQNRSAAPPVAGTGAPPAGAFAPPAHSVAVLPFVNMSGDPRQDYFSDGLSEELLNSLVTIHDLQVAARTSSFSFKGKDTKLADIARELNVGAVLEGSVRKDGNHVRITAQLVNAVTGFHLWSQTYDRDLKDVLKLQTEIAGSVSAALQATLMGNGAATADIGGTKNPEAFDAFLRGEKGRRESDSEAVERARIAAYDEAIRLDPGFAKAYSGKANALAQLANYVPAAAISKTTAEGVALAEKAVRLAPELGEAHDALGNALLYQFDFARGSVEIERALALTPGDARVLRSAANLDTLLGRTETAIANARRAVALDPLNEVSHGALGNAYSAARRYPEAIAAFDQELSLRENSSSGRIARGFAEILAGNARSAVTDCAIPPLDWSNHTCLAIAYDKLGRHAEAAASQDALQAAFGETASYQHAEIYAQWGNKAKALDWLETAYRVRDPGLSNIRTDPFLDPLRAEPRFHEIEAKLHFPD